MKNLKFLLPMLAFIFAIGVAFATVELKAEPTVQAKDYVYLGNNNWEEISEQSCEGDEKNCQVQFGVGGPFYNVYDEMSLTTLKRASAEHVPAVIIIN